MKNSIRKRHYKHKHSLNLDNIFLHDIAFVNILLEILVGAVFGVSLCFGFVLSFFVIKGSLLVSVLLFFVIIIFALFLVFLFKCIHLSVMLKVKEIEILDKIYNKS